jgi:hypothetical protein
MPSLHHMYTHTHTPKYTSYTSPSIQIHVHKLNEFEIQDLMEASKCLSHQVTQLFVGKVLCNILLYFVNYESIWKSQLWHFFFCFDFCSNETNKGNNLVAYSKI